MPPTEELDVVIETSPADQARYVEALRFLVQRVRERRLREVATKLSTNCDQTVDADSLRVAS